MKLDTIRLFAILKLEWIKRQQVHMVHQERETPREYLERESHFVWGKRYLLKIEEVDAAPKLELQHRHLLLSVRPGSNELQRREILDAWYRAQVKAAVPAMLAKWEPLLGVKTDRFFVQRMKTRWGSCTPITRSIRLNTDLAKKPPGCLEYIVLHELVHLLEPTHSARFNALIEQFMPTWRHSRGQLNRLPVRHENWKY